MVFDLLFDGFNLLFGLMRIVKSPVILCGVVLMLSLSGANFAQVANKIMNESRNTARRSRPKFYKVLDKILPERGLKKASICDETDAVQMRLLNEYGAIFVIGKGITPPPVCIFTTSEAVEKFQQRIFKAGAEIEGTHIELQTVAMAEYLKAREEGLKKNLDITPRGGSEAARRSFADTVRLWKSRVEPACQHWLKEGRLTAEQVEKLKSLPLKEQIGAVLELEKQGIFFNTFFNNSILYSVAAPGASQHLSMLALDVAEFDDEEVRKILARHGWFRTVRNDAPHFTFLGRRESDLKKIGLEKIETNDGEFWIPETN